MSVQCPDKVVRRWMVLVNSLAFLAALALIWMPEVWHYWVGPTDVPDSAIVKARTLPSRSVLEEISRMALSTTVVDVDDAAKPDRLRRIGDDVIAGSVRFAGQPVASLPFPFRAAHLDAGLPGYQLRIASMGTVSILAEAAAATGERRFLEAALEEVVAFDKTDKWRLVPRGLIWNDHALAIRVSALVRVWSLGREGSDIPHDSARVVLELADRTGARLAKPELFNPRTNHGIAQSLALVQLAAAFPTLPQASHYLNIGCDRLIRQMRYYVEFEGPVLEHSASYHDFGRALLKMAIRLFEMGGCATPEGWPQLLERVTEFSGLLRRPDQTLPEFGNTSYDPYPVSAALRQRPRYASRVFDVAGFAVGWRGLDHWPDPQFLSQYVLTWSNFPTRAHKLADDMSVIIWARGQTLIGNSGYWPYGVSGYDAANGWRGSNAPHFSGERPDVRRETELLGASSGKRATVLDVRRVNADGSFLRRQFVEVDGGLWIILDSSSHDSVSTIDRVWTSSLGTAVDESNGREFLLGSAESGLAARLYLVGSLAGRPTIRFGQFDPFGGWIVRSGKPAPAPAIDVRQPGGAGPLATVIVLGSARSRATFIGSDQGGENWGLSVIGERQALSVIRSGNSVLIDFGDGTAEALELNRPVDTDSRRQRIVSEYETMRQEFPGTRELTSYRYMLSKLALLLLAGQEVFVGVIRRWRPRTESRWRLAASLCWLALGAYAMVFYLK